MKFLRDWLSELLFSWDKMCRPMRLVEEQVTRRRNVLYHTVTIVIDRREFTRHYALGFTRRFITYTLSVKEPGEGSAHFQSVCQKSLTLPAMLPGWVSHEVQYELVLQAYLDYLHGYLVKP